MRRVSGGSIGWSASHEHPRLVQDPRVNYGGGSVGAGRRLSDLGSRMAAEGVSKGRLERVGAAARAAHVSGVLRNVLLRSQDLRPPPCPIRHLGEGRLLGSILEPRGSWRRPC